MMLPLQSYSVDPPFPVKVTAVAAGSGSWAGKYLYTWTEQRHDPATGSYADAASPRNGSAATSKNPLLEINNVLLATFPVFAWARFRGVLFGQPTYEFEAGRAGGGPLSEPVVIGGSETTIPLAGATPTVQLGIHDEGTTDIPLVLYRHNTTAASTPELIYARSRGTEATESAVTAGDYLGRISWVGWDGTDYERAVTLRAEVDGTPGAGDMPGRLVVATTPDGSATPVDRLMLESDGEVGLGTDGWLTYDQMTAPSAPPAGRVAVYAKTDGLMYSKDPAGVETALGSSSPGANFPRWTKYTKSHTDFQTAATTNTLVVATLAAKEFLHAVVIHVTTNFAGTGWTNLQLSIEYSTVSVISPFNAVAGTPAYQTSAFAGGQVGSPISGTVLGVGSMSGTTTVNVQADSSGANLDQSTAGACDIWLLTSLLP